MPLQCPGWVWCLHKAPVTPARCWEQFWCTLAFLSSRTESEREAKCHREVLTHQLSQKVSHISKIHGVKFRVCLQVAGVCGNRGTSSRRFSRNARVSHSRPGGGFLQEAEMPLPPQSEGGISPNFREDDAEFAPQPMTLFLKEYKCLLPTTQVTTLESYQSQHR